MICLDTGPVIWAIQGQSDPERPHMPAKMKAYLRQLRNQDHRIMVPTVVLAEFLTGFSDDRKRLEMLRIMSEEFVIAPLDAQAAAKAAEIEFTRRPVISELQAEGHRKCSIKADVLVLSTAITRGAVAVVADDKHMESISRLSGGLIDVLGVPETFEQGSLLEGHAVTHPIART